MPTVRTLRTGWRLAVVVLALATAAGVLAPSPAGASDDVSAMDDFERADGDLGSQWVSDRGTWLISDGEALSQVAPQNNVATFRPVALGVAYQVSADVSLVSDAPTGREWAGIVANVNGESSLNSYVLRVTTAGEGRPLGQWQLLSMADSTNPTLVASGEMDAPYGTPMRLTLARNDRSFDVEVLDLASGAVLASSAVELDVADPVRVGGHAGLYSNTGNLRAQSLSVTSTTPPLTPPGALDCTPEDGSYEFPAADDEVLERVGVETTWAGMYVEQEVLTDGDDQYLAYYDVDRRMTIAHRDLGDPDATWTRQKLPSTLGWDSHNYISMGLDRAGQLHVSGNMHNVPLVYFRTTIVGDVTSLTRIDSMVDPDSETSVTYPEFVNRKDGSLVFSYRNGGSGDGVTFFNVYDETTGTWARLVDEPLFDGSGSSTNPGGTWNAYFEGPVLGPDGLFHLLWVWRDTPDAATNSMITYARSENLVDWTDSAGEPVEAPFRYGEGDVVDPIPDRAGLLNGNAKIGFDDDDAPVISYHKYDEAGASELYAARADGTGSWDINQISDWTGRWDFGGGGTLDFRVEMLGSDLLDSGDVRVDFLCDGEEESIVIDDALQPLAQVSTPALPDEVIAVDGTYPGLEVNALEDVSGATERGTWYLRWESLPENRDRPRAEWPTEGSDLELVLIGTPGSGQTIEVTVPEVDESGEFIWTIDGDGVVDLGATTHDGTHLGASGAIDPIAVTDTRVGGPGWSISGQVGDFTGGLSGTYLGWSPEVLFAGAGAAAGPPVASGIDGGDGLRVPRTLASATAGHERGTARLGADLDLRLPVDTAAGDYTATLTITALS